jgi:hypothetical protein
VFDVIDRQPAGNIHVDIIGCSNADSGPKAGQSQLMRPSASLESKALSTAQGGDRLANSIG